MTDRRRTNPITSFRNAAGDPALARDIQRLVERNWPRFVVEAHDAPGFPPADWLGMYDRWPHLQLGAFDAKGRLVAAANACALAWNGDPGTLPDEGWAWALSAAQDDLAAGRAPDTLCGLGITVDLRLQGQRLSPAMVDALRDLARANDLPRLIVPVRPTWKARYPLTPMEEYARWLREDQLPFDPWLRTHVRVGGRIAKVCHRSMGLAGSVREWEAWTGMQFPQSGEYPIPGGLAPLQVDVEQGRGLYVEPNVWVVHDLG
jgi:hypothetical protein